MKYFLVAASLLLSSGLVHADEIYQCKDFLQKRNVELKIVSNRNGQALIILNLESPTTNEDFSGDFGFYGPIPTQGFAVEGTIASGNDKIHVTLEGSLGPDGADLSLYGNGDRRIDYGYGDPLECGKAQQ